MDRERRGEESVFEAEFAGIDGKGGVHSREEEGDELGGTCVWGSLT